MAIKYKVKISVEVNRDLNDIFTYITDNLHSQQTAFNLMREIQDKILSLGEMPERFGFSLEPIFSEKGYRKVTVKKYVILYKIDEKNKIVNVSRVFHERMNYSKYI